MNFFVLQKKRSSPEMECLFHPKTSVLQKQKRNKKKVFTGNGVSFSPQNQWSLKNKKIFTGNGVSF